MVQSLVLRVLAAAGLAYQAYVHFDLASRYAAKKDQISQEDLFRIEGVAAVIAALAVLFLPRRGAVLAFFVAAGGLAAVLVYRYIDVGAFAGLPNMYEPLWFSEKTNSAIAEAVAAVAALLLIVRRRARTD